MYVCAYFEVLLTRMLYLGNRCIWCECVYLYVCVFISTCTCFLDPPLLGVLLDLLWSTLEVVEVLIPC